MPWNEVSLVEQRQELVLRVLSGEVGVADLCREVGISRKTAYKWLGRYGSGAGGWAFDRSRRPHRSPGRTSADLEALILAVRDENPAWGGRKIRWTLERQGLLSAPSASTITEVLRRHGRLGVRVRSQRDYCRFERSRPNELWQMDFKGSIGTRSGRCHPLTVLDDYSRYSVCVSACANEREETVRPVLVSVFRDHGLPEEILSDNGSCWGSSDSRYTKLSAWFLRLGIAVRHGRAYHPQTQGKDERFNRTLKAEAITGREFADDADCQLAFDRFRRRYNEDRPHEALGMLVPSSRYEVSPRSYPEVLPALEYGSGDLVRVVNAGGMLHFRSSFYAVGRAFSGDPVGLRAMDGDGVYEVYYGWHRVGVLDEGSGRFFQT
jgi:transposase InsO family protein